MKLHPFSERDICAICGKHPQMAYNRPHSQHKTKKIVRPNLTKFMGAVLICAKCRKAMLKPESTRPVRPSTVTTTPAV